MTKTSIDTIVVTWSDRGFDDRMASPKMCGIAGAITNKKIPSERPDTHLELRVEIEAAGRAFETRSNTKVLPHLHKSDGPMFVSRLRGMFALELYDWQSRQIMLAREHLGQKSLSYIEDDDELALASEIKAELFQREERRA